MCIFVDNYCIYSPLCSILLHCYTEFMNKILIISDSNSYNLFEAFEMYFRGEDSKIKISEEIIRKAGKKDVKTNSYSFNLYDTTVEILGLISRSAYNFINYIDCIDLTQYKDYDIYMYLGFNDYTPMYVHKNHIQSAKKYVNDIYNTFNNTRGIHIILPLPDIDLFSRNTDYYVLHQEYIDNVKINSENKNIELIYLPNIVGFIDNKDYDGVHLISSKYIPLIRHILKK